jgi:hypothetical protein
MITIKPIEFNDSELLESLTELISLSFQQDKIHVEYLKKNIFCEESSLTSLVLGAFEEKKLVGCNAFIANDFNLNGREISCFQSCWSATHPNFQGRGIFISIQNEAKKILSDLGAMLIYGLPNDQSLPIFISKLDFYESECIFTRIPNIPLLRKAWIKYASSFDSMNSNVLITKEKQISKFKSITNSKITKINIGRSYAWGKIEIRKKFNINIKVFNVGGMSIHDENEFREIINQLFLLDCHFIEIYSCKSNQNNKFFRNWKISPIHRFIFFNLDDSAKDIEHFNLMMGISDTF